LREQERKDANFVYGTEKNFFCTLGKKSLSKKKKGRRGGIGKAETRVRERKRKKETPIPTKLAPRDLPG